MDIKIKNSKFKLYYLSLSSKKLEVLNKIIAPNGNIYDKWLDEKIYNIIKYDDECIFSKYPIKRKKDDFIILIGIPIEINGKNIVFQENTFTKNVSGIYIFGNEIQDEFKYEKFKFSKTMYPTFTYDSEMVIYGLNPTREQIFRDIVLNDDISYLDKIFFEDWFIDKKNYIREIMTSHIFSLSRKFRMRIIEHSDPNEIVKYISNEMDLVNFLKNKKLNSNEIIISAIKKALIKMVFDHYQYENNTILKIINSLKKPIDILLVINDLNHNKRALDSFINIIDIIMDNKPEFINNDKSARKLLFNMIINLEIKAITILPNLRLTKNELIKILNIPFLKDIIIRNGISEDTSMSDFISALMEIYPKSSSRIILFKIMNNSIIFSLRFLTEEKKIKKILNFDSINNIIVKLISYLDCLDLDNPILNNKIKNLILENDHHMIEILISYIETNSNFLINDIEFFIKILKKINSIEERIELIATVIDNTRLSWNSFELINKSLKSQIIPQNLGFEYIWDFGFGISLDDFELNFQLIDQYSDSFKSYIPIYYWNFPKIKKFSLEYIKRLKKVIDDYPKNKFRIESKILMLLIKHNLSKTKNTMSNYKIIIEILKIIIYINDMKYNNIKEMLKSIIIYYQFKTENKQSILEKLDLIQKKIDYNQNLFNKGHENE